MFNNKITKSLLYLQPFIMDCTRCIINSIVLTSFDWTEYMLGIQCGGYHNLMDVQNDGLNIFTTLVTWESNERVRRLE